MIKESAKKQLKKYFFWAIIAILILLSYTIIKNFIIPLFSAFILSYLCIPLHKRLKKKVGNKFSAILCMLLILLILIIPLGAIATGITKQATTSLSSGAIVDAIERLSTNELVQTLSIDLDAITEKLTMLTISLVGSAASHLPSMIITLIIIFLGIFYMLTEWEEISTHLKLYIPFNNKKKIVQEIKDSTNGLVYGSILISFIEFAVAVAGFYISGVSFYLLLPVLIFFLAFIPGLGPTIVWLPLAIYYGIIGNYWALTGVAITGIILSIGIDTILRSKILGHKANIHPFVMMLGVLGGISVFGIFGFILGPLILVYTIKLVQEVFISK